MPTASDGPAWEFSTTALYAECVDFAQKIGLEVTYVPKSVGIVLQYLGERKCDATGVRAFFDDTKGEETLNLTVEVGLGIEEASELDSGLTNVIFDEIPDLPWHRFSIEIDSSRE